MPISRWTEQQKNYQMWLGIPQDMRPDGLVSVDDFAREARLSADVLSLWETLPGFWDSVYERGRSVIGRSMADIMATMRDKATGGSVQAAKLCLALMGISTEKLDVRHSMDSDQLMLILDPDAARELEEERSAEFGEDVAEEQ